MCGALVAGVFVLNSLSATTLATSDHDKKCSIHTIFQTLDVSHLCYNMKREKGKRLDTQTRPDSRTTFPPQHTSFIGREAEIAEITKLLGDPHCHLLTLVGPGGCGKTRLAVQIATRMSEAFAEGAFFVPLQPLQSSEQVISTIIKVLNFRPEDDVEPETALLTYLRNRNLLLLLDNFEHLMLAAELVAEILEAAPHVKLLVTSREPLNLREEWVREVGGLVYPDNGAVSDVADYSALTLFADRAHRLRSDFSLADEYTHVVRICQLVGGLPLALELAAGWLRTLSCAAIAHEIETNVDILAATTRNLPDRHRSMRAVFDHSWQLLTDEERAVMPRFSVFRGGCTREAAEEVTGATLPILASLVEKSLLRHDPTTDRYHMHELLRHYAHERLESSTDKTRVCEIHAHYYGNLFSVGYAFNYGSGKLDFGDLIHTELDNIRLSWIWGLAQEHYEVIDQLIDPLWAYFVNCNRTFELGALCQAAVAQLATSTDKSEQAILGRVLSRLGKWSASVSKIDLAESYFRQSMTIAQEQNNQEEYYYAARWLALHVLANIRSEYKEAITLLEQCVAFYHQQDDKFYLAQSLSNLGRVYGKWGLLERQNDFFHESVRVFAAMDHLLGVTETLSYLGGSAILQGQWERAQQNFTKILSSIQNENHAFYRWMAAAGHHGLITIATMRGDFAQARQYGCTLLSLLNLSNDTHHLTFEITLGFNLNQSMILAADGASIEALRLADDVFASVKQGSRYPELVERGRVIRAMVLCDLVRFDEASQEIGEILSAMSQHYHISVNLLMAIATAARSLVQSSKPTRAAELLSLVFTCPNSPQGYLERHQGMTRLRADLEAQLGTEAFAAAWERGTQLDVKQVARELLHEFSDDDRIAQANQLLPDPLTPRELDVLSLLADGLTNPQIAERLFITTGTVKGHVNKILQKLAVANRQQAVGQARALHLLDL